MVTEQEFEDCMKQYSWTLLSCPDTLLGKVFIDSHPEITQYLVNKGPDGIADLMIIWQIQSIDELRVKVKEIVKSHGRNYQTQT